MDREAAHSFWGVLAGCLLASCNGLHTAGPPATNAARLEKVEAMYQAYRRDFPEVNEITPRGLLDLHGAEASVLVDVRTPEEQAVSMLPGAITREAFEAARDLYRNRTVVTYCTIGARSGEYAEALRREGCEVFNLKGSILAWTHAGLPLVDRDGSETKKLHTYGSQWDLAAEGYEAQW